MAQGLRLGRWDGSLELVGDAARAETDTGGSQSTNENTRTEERLTLRNTGAYVIDPRLLTFTLGGTFGYSQEDSTVKDNGTASEQTRDGDLNGYDAFFGILPGNAVSLNLVANRHQSSQIREFASRTDIDNENRGATLFAKRLYIPSTLTFRQQFTDEQARSGSSVTGRDERRDILSYDGRRGWVNSEMVLGYESIDKTDQLRPELDYESQTGNLYYSMDFGSELNRRWDSRIRGYDRTGSSEEERFELDELLRIDHTRRLRSQYRYFFVNTDRPEGETTTHTGEFNLRHKLYESLVTELRLNAIDQALPDADKQIYDSRLNLDYTKRVPRNGTLTAGVGLYYAEEDNRFETTTPLAGPESHTYTPGSPILLANPNVITTEVSIQKVGEGPIPPGCSPAPQLPIDLTEGQDYTLDTPVDITEIVPIACTLTTPGINPGDTIEVTYRYAVAGLSLGFTTTSWRLNLALDYGWIRPYYIHDELDQDLDEGEDESFLNDRRSDTLGVELKHDQPRLRASLRAETERYTSRNQDYDAIRVIEFVGYSFAPGWRLTFNGEQSTKEFSSPNDRETDILAARAALTYALRANLFAELLASVRDLDDTLIADERTEEIGLQLRWRFGKLEIDPSLKFVDVEREQSDLQDYRATVRIARRF